MPESYLDAMREAFARSLASGLERREEALQLDDVALTLVCAVLPRLRSVAQEVAPAVREHAGAL